MNHNDVFRALRNILDFLGFDLFQLPEFNEPSSSSLQFKKRHRSILRRIGSICSFIQINRLHLQPHLIGSDDNSNLMNRTASCPNLCDLGWIMDAHQDSFAKLRSDLNTIRNMGHSFSVSRKETSKRASIPVFDEELACSTPNTTFRSMSVPADMVALDKITALEEELVKLRELLAHVVGKQPDVIPSKQEYPPLGVQQAQNFCVPPPPPLSVPAPPPPPPPPVLDVTPRKSVQDVIRENRLKNGKSSTSQSSTQISSGQMPNMADVLKDLKTVKLRSIGRSPGGTPFTKKDSASSNNHNDPVALIAAALRKKFAHQYTVESPERKCRRDCQFSPEEDKENSSSFSPSPAKAEFGQHLLRPRHTGNGIPLTALNQ